DWQRRRAAAAARGADPLRLQGHRGARSLLLSVDLLPRAGRCTVRGRDDVAGIRRRRGRRVARPRAQAATLGGAASREHRADAAGGDRLMQFFAPTYEVVPNFAERLAPVPGPPRRLARQGPQRPPALAAPPR